MAIDWGKVAEERKGGTSVPDLAKKYKVTTTTIYNHTGKGGKRSATVRPASVTAALVSGHAVVHSNGSGLFSGELKSLKQKRAVIDRAIQTLESAG